jgi:hypothetical protein
MDSVREADLDLAQSLQSHDSMAEAEAEAQDGALRAMRGPKTSFAYPGVGEGQ